MTICEKCSGKAQIKRAETGKILCSNCFIFEFEEEVYQTINKFNLIEFDDTVAIGVSGGKDSTALMHVLHTINERYQMKFQIHLICIDEGIIGYRNHALESVKLNSEKYKLPLTIISFTELFGYSLDEIFRETQTKETCTYCGIFRRRALDLGAEKVKANKVAVGHNADDMAETVIMNALRGDLTRFQRSVDLKTNGIEGSVAARIKPFAFQTQREIVLYAHFLKLSYYAIECPYAVQAFRRFPREYLVSKQKKDPLIMRRIIEGSIKFQTKINGTETVIQKCNKCGNSCNHELCMVCKLLEKINLAHAQKKVQEDPE